MVLSIELKFGVLIIDHHQTQPIDFDEHRTYTFLTGVDKIIFMHYGLWGQVIKSVQVSKQFTRTIQIGYVHYKSQSHVLY